MDSPGVSGAAKGLMETQKRLKQAPEAGKKKIKIRGLQTHPLMVRYHFKISLVERKWRNGRRARFRF